MITRLSRHLDNTLSTHVDEDRSGSVSTSFKISAGVDSKADVPHGHKFFPRADGRRHRITRRSSPEPVQRERGAEGPQQVSQENVTTDGGGWKMVEILLQDF